MTKDIIKKAFDAADKEHQEEEIKKIKQIVQKHLEEIERLSKNKKEVEEQIKVHREILDDLKAGRLDKIEEYLEKDEHARQIALIVVKKVEKEYVPMYPWRSPWTVEWKYTPSLTLTANSDSTTWISAGTNTNLVTNTAYLNGVTGTTFANFTGGSYNVGSRTINL